MHRLRVVRTQYIVQTAIILAKFITYNTSFRASISSRPNKKFCYNFVKKISKKISPVANDKFCKNKYLSEELVMKADSFLCTNNGNRSLDFFDCLSASVY